MKPSRVATPAGAILLLASLGTVGPSTLLGQNVGDYYVIISSDTTRAEAEEKAT